METASRSRCDSVPASRSGSPTRTLRGAGSPRDYHGNVRALALAMFAFLAACSGSTQVRLSGSVDVTEENPTATWVDCTPLGRVSGEGHISPHHGGRPPVGTLDSAQNDALRDLRVNARERGATVLHLEKATWDGDDIVLEATAFRCRAEATKPLVCTGDGEGLVTCGR